MLDCDGYPHAFIENENIRFEFTDAKYDNNKIIKANVKIFPK